MPSLFRISADLSVTQTITLSWFTWISRNFHLKVTAKTRSQFVHAKPFRIVIPEPISLEEIGNRLSEPLATVEEVVVGWYITSGRCQIQWRIFFDHMQQVKLVNLPSQVALGVARSFQRDGQEPAMDVLPPGTSRCGYETMAIFTTRIGYWE